MTLVYINDELIDLYPNVKVAQTVQSVDIGNPSFRGVSHTNAIKCPPTENNNRIFANLAFDKSVSTTHYSLFRCKVVRNGIETLNGFAYLNEFSESYSLSIFETIIDIFSFIENKTLLDINPIAVSAWDAAGIDAARLATSGALTAILNWGKSGAIFQLNFFLPCFFYNEIVKDILQSSGLVLSGDILTDTRFTDLVIPYPLNKFEYSEPVYNESVGYEDFSTNGTVSGIDFDNPFHLLFQDDPITIDPILTANFTPTEFTFPIYSNANVTIHLIYSGILWGDQTELRFLLQKFDGFTTTNIGGGLIATVPAVSGTATFSTGDTDFNIGDQIYCILIGNNSAVNTLTVDVDGGYMQVEPTSKVNRSSVMWSKLMPDTKLKDIIKDFTVRFGIVYKQYLGTLYMKTIQSIITDQQGAIDWTAKRATNKEQVINLRTSYAQVNKFTYDDLIGEENTGRGDILIENNEIINPTQDIYESVFGNSVTQYKGVYKVATIPVYNNDSTDIFEFGDEPGLRLLTLKNRISETAITFDAIARTDYRLAYFVDPLKTKDTGFQYFLDQFYPALSDSLQNNKIITRYYNLSEIDVASYDPFKMIFDNGSYFLINKIWNFIPGDLTRVDLFKVQ